MVNSFKRNLLIGGVLCVGMITLIAGTSHRFRKASAGAATVPAVVEVVRPKQQDVPIYGEWIGALDGLVNADVRAQVTGYLLKQGYKEGAFVKIASASHRGIQTIKKITEAIEHYERGGKVLLDFN